MRRYIITLVSFIYCALQVGAQQFLAEKNIADILSEEGFEDIATRVAEDTVFLSIEDRTYRGTFRGAATAIQRISAAHGAYNQFELVLTDYKMPQLIVHASKREGIWDVRVDRQFHRALSLLRQQPTEATSTAKVDITLFPMVSLINNKLYHLYDYSVRIAPAIAMTLWRGARVTIQPIIPVAHYLDDTNSMRFIQPGVINLSQQWLSNKHWHLSSAVGFFHPERMGVQAAATWHSPIRGLDLSVDAGYTGLANYDKENGFGVNTWNRFNIMAKADYYEPYTKVQVELQAGQFLFGDRGGRVDLTRHFSEYAIGVYGIYTSGETNMGFHFAIPFGGKRQKRSGAVRLRLPEYYSWEYSYKSYFKYYLERMGESYSTQPDDNHSAHYWEPAYVEEYVQRILNGDFE